MFVLNIIIYFYCRINNFTITLEIRSSGQLKLTTNIYFNPIVLWGLKQRGS